jgi:hypothetical protein
VKSFFMTGILPDHSIENNGGINSLNVIPFVDQPAPPILLYVIAKLDTEWTVVPGAAESPVNLGRRKDKASSLCQGYDGFDVWCGHCLLFNYFSV